jgi:hypothetical protein
LSITDPAAVLLRTLFAVVAEALLLLLTTRLAPNHAPAAKTSWLWLRQATLKGAAPDRCD